MQRFNDQETQQHGDDMHVVATLLAGADEVIK
jgi:hypothetical protein